jgi:phosphopentomutase
MDRRALVVVLDACGCGALPDADAYGDAGANTLAHVAEAVGGLELPTLASLGLGNVVPLLGVEPTASPAVHGRLWPLGPGKDTTAGHWEMMGVRVPPMPTYPAGFPSSVIAEFSRVVGREVIGNAPSEGLRAIDEHGEEHLSSGALIVYTSQDSVFQVAAHVDVVPEEELYSYCLAAREIMSGEHAVGRVIARPFEGAPGAFVRTAGRRDFALPPPGRSYLDEIVSEGVPVHAVGKVGQIFAGRGVSFDHHAPDNASAVAEIDHLLASSPGPMLVFANLVDTDQLYGHRKDVHGFHGALRAIDDAVARWLTALGDGDLLVLCADHGCDPLSAGTDHTREYSPLLAVCSGSSGERVEAPLASIGATALKWLTGSEPPDLPGEPFA